VATASKTWVFASNNEGLADQSISANITVAWSATDGNPAGSLEWTRSGGTGAITEKASKSAGDSWETLFGIPAGSTVTDVQVLGWDELSWSTTDTRRVRFRIISTLDLITVHSAGDLFDTGSGTPSPNNGTPAAKGAGTSRAVDALYQPSSSAVSLEIEVNVTTSSTLDIEQDNIQVQITYTPPGAASAPFVPRRMPLGA